MDQALVQFRHAAARENRGRRGLQRRYSPALQQRAVEYWRQRRRAGDGVPAVAAALGIAPWSLHRWIQAAKTRVRFHPVQLITPEPVEAAPGVVIRFTADGPRVEGLDVEAVAKLLVLLR
jgi:transposase-like protein